MIYPRILQKFDNLLVNTINAYTNKRWYKSPLIKKPIGTKEDYLKIAQNAQNKTYLAIDIFEKEYGFAINSDWLHELALHTQVVKKKSEIAYQHGRLLYSLLRNYINKNELDCVNIIETGTARGFSVVCMAKALHDSGTHGKIITFDVLPHQHKMYWNCIDDIEGKKTRSELLKNYHNLTEKYIIFHQGNTTTEMPKVQMERIHFAFLDGGHDEYHVMKEFENIKNAQHKGDIIFFDDYTHELFPGVVKAVDKICRENNYILDAIKLNESRAYAIAVKN